MCQNQQIRQYAGHFSFSILPELGMGKAANSWLKRQSYQFWNISTPEFCIPIILKLITSHNLHMYGWKCPVKSIKIILKESNCVIKVL